MEYFYLFMLYFETFKDINKLEMKNNCNFDHFYLFKLHIKFKNLIIFNFGNFKILNSKFQNLNFLSNFRNFKIQNSRFIDIIKYKFILTLKTKLSNIFLMIHGIRPNTKIKHSLILIFKIAYHFCIILIFKLYTLIIFINLVCRIVNPHLIFLNFKLSMMDNSSTHRILDIIFLMVLKFKNNLSFFQN